MKRTFVVVGLCPYAGKAVNDLIACLDLGILGGFVEKKLVLTATIGDNVTPEQTTRQVPGIKAAFEDQGWRDVKVTEMTA